MPFQIYLNIFQDQFNISKKIKIRSHYFHVDCKFAFKITKLISQGKIDLCYRGSFRDIIPVDPIRKRAVTTEKGTIIKERHSSDTDTTLDLIKNILHYKQNSLTPVQSVKTSNNHFKHLYQNTCKKSKILIETLKYKK